MATEEGAGSNGDEKRKKNPVNWLGVAGSALAGAGNALASQGAVASPIELATGFSGTTLAIAGVGALGLVYLATRRR